MVKAQIEAPPYLVGRGNRGRRPVFGLLAPREDREWEIEGILAGIEQRCLIFLPSTELLLSYAPFVADDFFICRELQFGAKKDNLVHGSFGFCEKLPSKTIFANFCCLQFVGTIQTFASERVDSRLW